MIETLILLGFFVLLGFFGRIFYRGPKNETRITYYGDPNVHLRGDK